MLYRSLSFPDGPARSASIFDAISTLDTESERAVSTILQLHVGLLPFTAPALIRIVDIAAFVAVHQLSEPARVSERICVPAIVLTTVGYPVHTR